MDTLIETHDARAPRRGRVAPQALLIRHAWALLLVPPTLVLVGVYYWPVVSILTTSVTDAHAQDLGWFGDFIWFFDNGVNVRVLVRTVVNAAEVSLICLLVGYPYAYKMTLMKDRMLALAMGAVVIPLWTSVVIRNFAWLILLQDHGALNYALVKAHLPTVNIIGTSTAVLIGECQIMLPFMALALYSCMTTIDRRLLDAASSLGSSRMKAFVRVYLPLSKPGIAAGIALVFIQALGFYITPAILGSGNSTLLPQLIVTQVNQLLDWGKGGAISIVLLVAIAVIMLVGSLLGRGNILSAESRLPPSKDIR